MGERQYWRDFFSRFKLKKNGLYNVETPEEQLDYIHALRGKTFFKDIRRRASMAQMQPDDSSSIMPRDRPWGNNTIMLPRGVTTLNQMPSFFWSVPEWEVLNAVTQAQGGPTPPTANEILTKHAVLRTDPRNAGYIAFTFDWWNGAGTLPVIGPPAVGLVLEPGAGQVVPIENLNWIRAIGSQANQYYSILYIPDRESW